MSLKTECILRSKIMEKMNNSLRRIVSSSVLFGFLAILLCAPIVRADVVVPKGGDPCDIDDTIQGNLEIYGTANFHPGAYVTDFIYAFPGYAVDEPGSTVNIYGCAPGNRLAVLTPADIGADGLPPVVTVYGSRFKIGIGDPFSPPDDKVINEMLYVLDDSEQELFSLMIWGENILIHLRAPGSTEKERLEAELCVMPKVMNRQRRRPVVFATLRLPEGITKDDVDKDYPLLLYTGENKGGIETNYYRMFQSCRRDTSRVKIFAFFNLGTLLEALPDNCEEMQIQVCGRLKSGQEFYGNDNIRIVSPRRKHWKNWRGPASTIKKYGHR